MVQNPYIPDEWRKHRERRNSDGSLTLIDQRSLSVGDFAHQLARGLFSHLAAITVASDPRAKALMPLREFGKLVPEGVVRGKNGGEGRYHFEFYLDAIRTDPFVQDQFSKVYLAGAIIELGDALSKYSYFNHQPELELIYHLRNGIAHGNRFNIRGKGAERLQKYFAHNKTQIGRSEITIIHEINLSLHGSSVFFDFLDAYDVLNLLFAVGSYCRELAYGTVGYRDS